MKKLTNAEIEKQDEIDNLIFTLIKMLAFNPKGDDLLTYIEWDMSIIGDVRDLIQEYVVDELKLCSEQEFYPYIKEEIK